MKIKWEVKVRYALLMTILLLAGDFVVQAVKYVAKYKHFSVLLFTATFWDDWVVKGFVLCFLGFLLQAIVMSSRIFSGSSRKSKRNHTNQ